ncbi:hypothetical protein [Pseudalkalibacillus sp. SCS-8]|uniref:hypothetical protein n=1 Tax=Pseudalkalibacillus nanhaiensis TaxID=3115291 RepID=UPI0032DB1D59
MKKAFGGILILLLVAVVLFPIYIFLVDRSDDVHKTFESLSEARGEIPDHHFSNAPKLPEEYRLTKITYDWDGDTAPIVKVNYETSTGKTLSFMQTSSWYDDADTEIIHHPDIKDMTWLKNGTEYILKWRMTNKESYKYLISNDLSDKALFVTVAERFSQN